ncbi:hypothetical protein LIER_18330 [Lithospermum erythrorhizon]|uniref:Uncharacterized protein n=1 Tax=Lithospermum erythrorhizon TaxID=34254 RepID=A0AAV3QI26_LITER
MDIHAQIQSLCNQLNELCELQNNMCRGGYPNGGQYNNEYPNTNSFYKEYEEHQRFIQCQEELRWEQEFNRVLEAYKTSFTTQRKSIVALQIQVDKLWNVQFAQFHSEAELEEEIEPTVDIERLEKCKVLVDTPGDSSPTEGETGQQLQQVQDLEPKQ